MVKQTKKPAYMLANIELAQENGRLKQELGQTMSVNTEQERKILQLKELVNELSKTKEKYDSIVRIVLDIPVTNDNSAHGDSLLSTSESFRDHSDEPSGLREGVECVEDANTDQNHSTRELGKSVNNDLHRITEQSEYDSLQPPENPSVSPFRLERVFHTPSIWRDLDKTKETPEEESNSSISQRKATFDKETRQVEDHENIDFSPVSHPVSRGVRFSNNDSLRRNEVLIGASPIQPVGQLRSGRDAYIDHSTPVVRRAGHNLSQQVDSSQNSETPKGKPEIAQNHDQATGKQASNKVKQTIKKGTKRPAQPAKSRKEEQSSGSQEGGAPRYNLRKRTKQ